MRAPDLIVAGAGMAGLAAAAQARSQGARVRVVEKGDRSGGSMLLSSGVIWRYRDWEEFRRQCPTGVAALQRRVFDRLDDDLAWLEQLGAPVVIRDTGNPLTTGARFATAGLRDVLLAGIDDVRLGEPLRELPGTTPVVLATGGFQASPELVARHITPEAGSVVLRAAPWSSGDGLALGCGAGGRLSAGLDEFYGCALPATPAPPAPERFVELVQRYARHAEVRNARGERFVARTWSEIEVVQWMARQPQARAWFRVPDAALQRRIRERRVRDVIATARAAGAPVVRGGSHTTVEVVAAITTTIGGLAVDEHARVAPGVFAGGADVGGISTGGYASGLAAALVLGRIAADAALGIAG